MFVQLSELRVVLNTQIICQASIDYNIIDDISIDDIRYLGHGNISFKN